jgi:hypothetical protein
VPQEAARAKALKEWVDALATASKAKESSLEQPFNQKVLGYELYPGSTASAWPKAPSSVTGISGEPAMLLGSFVPDEPPSARLSKDLHPPVRRWQGAGERPCARGR